jgi:hypothetical protein
MMNWLIGLEHVPLVRLILGTACAWALTLGIPIWLAVTPSFDNERRITIEGEILDVATLLVMDETVLDFALRNHSVRFRIQPGIFRTGFNGRVPSDFRPGAIARVQVFDSEYRNPYSPVPYRVPTASVNAIQIADVEILPLSVARQWHEENRRWAWYLLPLFAAGSVILSWGTWVKLGQIRGLADFATLDLQPGLSYQAWEFASRTRA